MNDKELKDILEFDPIDDAERKTGQSYKTSKFTAALGFISHLEHTANKHTVLAQLDDTSMATPLPDYLRIVKEIGFETVYHESFLYKKYGHTDEQYIMWRNGVLLSFDTWHGNKVNGGNFYYNWRYNVEKYWEYTSSGHIHKTENVYVGHHDCREAIRFHIRKLEENGSFLPVWIETVRPWLINYNDSHKVEELYGDNWTLRMKEYDRINKEKIERLPKNIQEAINAS